MAVEAGSRLEVELVRVAILSDMGVDLLKLGTFNGTSLTRLRQASKQILMRNLILCIHYTKLQRSANSTTLKSTLAYEDI